MGLCVLALRSEASDSPAPHLHPCGLGRVTGPSEPVTVSSTSQIPSKIWRKVTCNGVPECRTGAQEGERSVGWN